METSSGMVNQVAMRFFKSHHSGMETPGQRFRPGRENTLNRTIVGWKREEVIKVGPVGDTFKSHHSGMETDFAFGG